MEIHNGWRGVPEARRAVLAIGNFDGVHRWSRWSGAREPKSKEAGAIIFEPHPRHRAGNAVLDSDAAAVDLSSPLSASIRLAIPSIGASLSADDFARDVLADGLGASAILVGYDFAYGKGRSGTPTTLQAGGKKLGFGVDIVEPVEEDGAVFASRDIREHLRLGEVREAAEELGYWWRVKGVVEKGHGRGKNLGFPTINLALKPGQDVGYGIYAMRVFHNGRRYPAAGYVGASPTFGGGVPMFEAYLLDFDGDLYGKEVEIEFIAKLRDDKAFPDGASLPKPCARTARRPAPSLSSGRIRTTRCAPLSLGRFRWIVVIPIARTRTSRVERAGITEPYGQD
jgi:riboflavin kinase/FMN adenylyltransferase